MFHFHGFQPASKDCLHVATRANSIKFRLRSWCLNFNTVGLHKGKIQCPPPPVTIIAQNAPERPVLDPVLENFILAGGRKSVPPAPSLRQPHDIRQHSQKQGYSTDYKYSVSTVRQRLYYTVVSHSHIISRWPISIHVQKVIPFYLNYPVLQFFFSNRAPNWRHESLVVFRILFESDVLGWLWGNESQSKMFINLHLSQTETANKYNSVQ